MSGLDELTREELIELILKQHETILKQEKMINYLEERIAELEAEVEDLRSKLDGTKGTPDWVKPNRKERREQERQDRKKRKHSFVRRRDVATEEVLHAVDVCPDCNRKLKGGWQHSRRQVIEIPDAPVKVIEHVLIARRCGVCGKVHIPRLGIEDGVIGKQRMGVRLMSLICTLSVAKRMPQRMIQKLLSGLYGLHISLGEINDVLLRVSEWAKPTVGAILREIRGSPDANADETGWREDGINGYLWSVSTRYARFYYFHRRRASRVIRHILGARFSGVLGCDFYVGYDFYLGPKQRCWVHLLRDLKKLADAHPEVEGWVEGVRSIYLAARKAALRDVDEERRLCLRSELERRLLLLAEPYVGNREHPQHVLCKRICRYISELFTFVEHPQVASHNNDAERAIRPAVIARKISGGTRSARGSQVKTRLMSVFATWALQGKDPIKACAEMIISAQTAVSRA